VVTLNTTRFDGKKFDVLPTERIHVFRMDFRTIFPYTALTDCMTEGDCVYSAVQTES
jgi:hypothetical protein